jgi:hypothetical protein
VNQANRRVEAMPSLPPKVRFNLWGIRWSLLVGVLFWTFVAWYFFG